MKDGMKRGNICSNGHEIYLLIVSVLGSIHPVNIYLFKFYNRNTRKMCEICSNYSRHWLCSGVFIVKFEDTSHLSQVFLLLTLNKWMLAMLNVEKHTIQSLFACLKSTMGTVEQWMKSAQS